MDSFDDEADPEPVPATREAFALATLRGCRYKLLGMRSECMQVRNHVSAVSIQNHVCSCAPGHDAQALKEGFEEVIYLGIQLGAPALANPT